MYTICLHCCVHSLFVCTDPVLFAETKGLIWGEICLVVRFNPIVALYSPMIMFCFCLDCYKIIFSGVIFYSLGHVEPYV